jgi:ABC-type bacteriocin/lantibiotic exporter with double-glycine peptidase domain
MIQFKNLLLKDKKFESIYKYLFKYKFWIKLSLLFTILNTVIQLPFPIITKVMIDKIILQQQRHLFLACVLAVLFIIPFLVAMPYLKQLFLFKLTFKTGIMLRKALCEHFLHLDLSLFQDKGPGYFSARIFNDIDSLVRSVYQVLFPILQNIFLFAAGLGLMVYLNWKLAIIPCLFFPVYGYLNLIIGKKLKKENERLAENKAVTFDFFTDMFQCIENIRCHVLERIHLQSFFKKDSGILRQNLKVFNTQLALESLNNMMMILTPTLVLIFGIPMIIEKAMTLGEYIAFTTFMTYMLGPVKFFFSSNITFQDFRVAIERVSEAFAWPAAYEYSPPGDITPEKNFNDFNIRMENVYFSYNNIEVLKNLSLSIKEGERVAIMGKSGSGKTTILKLIMGLYLPDKGEIKVGGKSYTQVDLIKLRKKMALVEQEPILFKGTIEDNIVLHSNNNVGEITSVEQAAKLANAHDFILEKEHGYKTDIKRLGNNLSVGQKQRIALSRFFYKGADILILDEPTSAIDKQSAVLIREAIKRIPSGETVIMVTHDPAMAEFADRIIVVENGEITEDGLAADILNDYKYSINYNKGDN